LLEDFFREEDFFELARFEPDFFELDRFELDFFALDFLPPDFFAPDFFDARLRGTFAPSSRASDRPMAMACLRLVTLRPEPLFSVPDFRLCIARLTLLPAALPYLRPPDDFFAAIRHSPCVED
jgi:hypothetical protein